MCARQVAWDDEKSTLLIHSLTDGQPAAAESAGVVSGLPHTMGSNAHADAHGSETALDMKVVSSKMLKDGKVRTSSWVLIWSACAFMHTKYAHRIFIDVGAVVCGQGERMFYVLEVRAAGQLPFQIKKRFSDFERLRKLLSSYSKVWHEALVRCSLGRVGQCISHSLWLLSSYFKMFRFIEFPKKRRMHGRHGKKDKVVESRAATLDSWLTQVRSPNHRPVICSNVLAPTASAHGSGNGRRKLAGSCPPFAADDRGTHIVPAQLQL